MNYRVTLANLADKGSEPMDVVVEANSHEQAQEIAASQNPGYSVKASLRVKPLGKAGRVLAGVVGASFLGLGILFGGIMIYKREFKDIGLIGFLIIAGWMAINVARSGEDYDATLS